jgi:uncharacterized protein (TIGR02186 family)
MKRLLSFLVCALLPLSANAQALIADLSSHIIAIETDFHGAELVLFGSIDQKLTPEDNLVFVVRGPAQNIIMRQKEQRHGIWMNTQQAIFEEIPSYYAAYSVNPLNDTVPPLLRQRNQLGLYTLDMPVAPNTNTTAAVSQQFRLEILQKKQQDNLYIEKVGTTSFLGDKLFRVPLKFPENVPTGRYTVDTFLLRKGEIVAAQTTPLHISKDGIGAEVFLFAHRHTTLYGLLAVLLAVAVGWGSTTLFKKV